MRRVPVQWFSDSVLVNGGVEISREMWEQLPAEHCPACGVRSVWAPRVERADSDAGERWRLCISCGTAYTFNALPRAVAGADDFMAVILAQLRGAVRQVA